ncbi:MAG: hypothetical protein IIY39_03005 [Firmicutes bacterium]|nr:hypothetical protein [Bacillota bacterium]
MKKIFAPLLLGLIFAIAFALSGCGDPPLQEAYEDLNALESTGAEVFYDGSKDILQISLYDTADLDKIFEKLDEVVKDQEIGGIFFRTKFTTDPTFIKNYAEKVAVLPVKSMSMLGIGQELADYSEGKWTKLLSKADILYLDSIFTVDGYKGDAAKDLKKVEKLWQGSDGFTYADMFPNVKEIGVSVGMLMTIDPSNEEGAEEEAAADSATEDSGSDDNSVEATAYTFSPTFTDAEDFMPLKKLKKLDHILIVPTASKYTLDYNGAGYIYAISNVKPNVLVNEPDKELDKDNLIKVKNVDISALDSNSYLKTQILESFLKPEVKKVYYRAKKFKKSSKTPRIRGRALVYMAEPDSEDWTGHRRYYDNGSLLDNDELSTKVKTPRRAGDYQTFIYAYPIYSYKGLYTSGTKGYAETYKVQVFDLKKKRAYESQTVDTVQPPQSFRYPKGSPPAKKCGDVSNSKVYKFIKNIKKVK